MKRKCRYCIYAVFDVGEESMTARCRYGKEANFNDCYVNEDTVWKSMTALIEEAEEHEEKNE